MKMLVLIILISNTMYAIAQPQFGIKGGASFSTMIVKDVPAEVQFAERNYAPGFYLGVFGILKITEKTSFTPEILFTQRGWKDAEGRKEITRFNYLEIPLLLSYTPHKKFSLETGPNVAYLISGENGLRRFYESVDIGINGGSRFALTNSLSITVRYYRGLRRLTEITFVDINGDILGESKEFSQCFQIGVNYTLK